MKRIVFFVAIAALIMESGMGRAEVIPLSELKADSETMAYGTVESLEDEAHFTLRNPTGTITVEVPDDLNITVEKGVHVVVKGQVARDGDKVKIIAAHIQTQTPEEAARQDMNSKQ